MSVISMRKLLENGCHYGHQTRRWNPKMKPYIYTAKNGSYIFDLNISMKHIDDAYSRLREISERDGKILFVGTKKAAQQVVLDEALRSGSFYINQRWLGGLLTNYRTIQKRIKRLLEIEQMSENGTLDLYPKKEVAQIRKEEQRLNNFLGGIKEMRKLPDALVIIDPTEEHNAVAEARKLNLPVFAVIDTNSDPDLVDHIIPLNDDGASSVKLIVTLLADAIVEAKGGVLSVAHQVEENEITMEDVLVNIDERYAENERRRKAKLEERRRSNNNRNTNGRRNDNRRFNRPNTEVKAEAKVEVKVEE
ncbi:MAG: 30S ribosomal protein S2 [Erysipelotrichaceae bacterium]